MYQICWNDFLHTQGLSTAFFYNLIHPALTSSLFGDFTALLQPTGSQQGSQGHAFDFVLEFALPKLNEIKRASSQAERKMDFGILGILSQIIVLNTTKISTSILVENLE